MLCATAIAAVDMKHVQQVESRSATCVVFRSSLTIRVGDAGTIWTTYEEPVSCDSGDMTPHHARRWSSDHPHGKRRASVRADRRNDPSAKAQPGKGGLGTSRGHPQLRSPGALDRCAGVTGLRGRRDGPQHEAPPLLEILDSRVRP